MKQNQSINESGKISEELEVVLNEEMKNEKNQKRRYYRHNISYEYLEEKHFYCKDNTSYTNSIIDSMLEFQETIEDDALYQAFRKLNEKDIEIIKLRYIEQLTFKEIALELNTKEDTVGKRHRRAISKLKKEILNNKK